MAGYIQDAIMIVGDSLVEAGTMPYGFCQQLIHAYNRKLDVIVRGLTGYNTTWILPVFEQILAKRTERAHLPKIQLLVIWFGANDSVLPGEQQHVPLPAFSANLRTLIHMVRDPASAWHAPETRVVLLAPPPVHIARLGPALATLRVPPKYELDRSAENTQRYAQAVVRVGEEEGVPVVDVWTVLWEAAGGTEAGLEKYLQIDGLHLNEEGHKLVYESFVDTIKKHFPEIHHDNLDMNYPPWQILNNDNYMDMLKRDGPPK